MTVRPSTHESNGMRFEQWRWILGWVGFAIWQIACMCVDWQLRDKSHAVQPMLGGIPDELNEALQWSGIVVMAIAAYLLMPRYWSIGLRLLLALIQALLALVVVVIGWLYYVLSNGIDTL